MTHDQLFYLLFILAGFLIFTGSLMAVAIRSLASDSHRGKDRKTTQTR